MEAACERQEKMLSEGIQADEVSREPMVTSWFRGPGFRGIHKGLGLIPKKQTGWWHPVSRGYSSVIKACVQKASLVFGGMQNLLQQSWT